MVGGENCWPPHMHHDCEVDYIVRRLLEQYYPMVFHKWLCQPTVIPASPTPPHPTHTQLTMLTTRVWQEWYWAPMSAYVGTCSFHPAALENGQFLQNLLSKWIPCYEKKKRKKSERGTPAISSSRYRCQKQMDKSSDDYHCHHGLNWPWSVWMKNKTDGAAVKAVFLQQ